MTFDDYFQAAAARAQIHGQRKAEQNAEAEKLKQDALDEAARQVAAMRIVGIEHAA